jgi:streptomycin 6-kinase
MLAVPDAVRRKARAVGTAGEQWLSDLPQLVAALEADWDIRVGAARTGGSGGYVADAITADGTLAVVKLAIPEGLEGQGEFAREVHTLRLGAGRGYVELLRADLDRRAMLQARLGRPLAALGRSVDAQIDAIASTLSTAWRPLPAEERLRTGAEQAHWLGVFIPATWEFQGRPGAPVTIELATRYARARRDAFDPRAAVLIHGDAHPANVLEDPNRSGAFKLIDPDGMRSEPAHDLAIPLRDWTDELLAGDAVALGRAWCARLGFRAGVDPAAIWEWAFVERVSTGLFLLRLGDPAGNGFLAVAGQWAAAST